MSAPVAPLKSKVTMREVTRRGTMMTMVKAASAIPMMKTAFMTTMKTMKTWSDSLPRSGRNWTHRNCASVQAEEIFSAHSSHQGISHPPSAIAEENVGIFIHGSLTLKTFQSNVVYCPTFSQDLARAQNLCVRRQGHWT